jgi:hypothetical protein
VPFNVLHKYKLFVLIFQALLIFCSKLIAGFDRVPQPTTLFSTAISGGAYRSPLNFWINPAASAFASSFSATFFYSPSPFGLSQLSNSGIVLSDQIYSMGSSVGVSTFGFSLYRETVGTLAVADSVTENVICGMGINIDHLKIEGYGSDVSVGVDVGLLFTISSQITIGSSLLNLNRPTIGGIDNSIPQTMILGIAYVPFEKNEIMVDFVKDIDFPISCRMGFTIQPQDNIAVRGGFDQQTKKLFAGLGIYIGSFVFTYGISSHSELGFTHSFGISIEP